MTTTLWIQVVHRDNRNDAPAAADIVDIAAKLKWKLMPEWDDISCCHAEMEENDPFALTLQAMNYAEMEVPGTDWYIIAEMP